MTTNDRYYVKPDWLSDRTGCWHAPVHSEAECPNWLGPRTAPNAPPTIWHLLIDPFSGSFPLCGARNATARTMTKAKVSCPDCLSLMNSPRAIESEARTAGLQAEAEARWRRPEPRLAAYMDSLKSPNVTTIVETRNGVRGPSYPNAQMARLLDGKVEQLPLLRRLMRWWKGIR